MSGDLVPGSAAADAIAAVALRAPAHRVSRRAIGYWALRASFGWLVLVAIEVGWLVGTDSLLGLRVTLLVVTALLAALHLSVMPQWRYRVHRWESTDQAVYTQTGWFTQERRIAPISRIQTVDTEFGVLERLFRLANVTVTTASAAGPIKIHGLDQDHAHQLAAQLTSSTAATPGDAT
jgi:membrane protein YdbS with pleckstrin-like domain